MVAPLQTDPGYEKGLLPPNSAATRPLLSVLSKEEVEQRDQRSIMAQRPSIVISNLAAHIDRCYEAARNERVASGVDEKLMSAMRQRKGEYDPEKLAAIKDQGGSEIFLLLTEEKCAGAEAWIADVLMPSDDKPWTISPTPIPDLPDYMVQRVVAETMSAVRQQIMAGKPPPPPNEVFTFSSNLRERYLAAMRAMAKEAAGNMERRIEDQLAECKFMDLTFYDFLRDVVTFGTGIIKGPLLRKAVQPRWAPNGQMYVSESLRLEFDKVSPLDFYPSPGAMGPNDGYNCHRLRNLRRQIEAMKGLEGVDNAAIDRVLTEFGSRGLRRYEYPDFERARLGDQTLLYNNDEIIEGVEFNGCVQGQMLIEWGMRNSGIIPLKEYDITAIKYGTHVVRTTLNADPLYRRKFFKAVFEPVTDSFWGRGVPHLMKDIQDVCNASARALVDNEGLASGPQAIIDDINRLPHDAKIETIHPRQIWQFVNPGQSRNKGVEFFTIESKATELLMIIEKFMSWADTRTRIPAYAYGSDNVAGAGETAQGLGMLMNAASRSIKKIIAGIDRDAIKPLIEAMYMFNMLYDPDQSIKGDCNIVAKGAIGLMVQEQKLSQIMLYLKDSANPVDGQIIDLSRRRNLWHERAKILGMPIEKAVPPEEEFRERLQAMASAPPAPAPVGKAAK